MDMDYELVVVFKHSGWQWGLSAGDVFEVYAPSRSRLIAEFPAPMILALLLHTLQGAMLTLKVSHALSKPLLASPAPPATPVPPVPQAPPRLRALNGRRLRGRTLKDQGGLTHDSVDHP